MFSVCSPILLLSIFSTIMFIIKFIVILCLILGIFLALILYHDKKEEKVIAARGGIKEIYSKLFEAIQRMPENKIGHSTASLTATYLNYSNKRCKIEVTATNDHTYVTFWIFFEDKWVKTKQHDFYGSFSGREILLKIIFNFPDCDLSDI